MSPNLAPYETKSSANTSGTALHLTDDLTGERPAIRLEKETRV